MLLVCLSHFAEIYSGSSGVSFDGVYYFTMMAAPTFMIISGMLLGFFYASKKSSFELVRRDYINRGIFILTVARLFICSAFILRSHGFLESLKYVYITDAVGVNMILGSTLINKVRPIYRILLGFICIILAWIIIIIWEPNNNYSELVKEAIFGDWEYSYFHFTHYAFPLLPWFGLYFIGSYFGDRLGSSAPAKDNSKIIIYFLKIGLCSIAVAVLVKLIFWLLKYYSSWPLFNSFTLWALTSPVQKSPPSILYFLFYGGLGLLFIDCLLYLEQKKWLGVYLKTTATIGRSSLFVFIIQYYLYYTILYAMNFHYSQVWPIYFLLSLFFIFLLARIWNSMNLNHFLTLGVIHDFFNGHAKKLDLPVEVTVCLNNSNSRRLDL